MFEGADPMASGSGNTLPGQGGEIFHQRWLAYARRRNAALFLVYGWVPECVVVLLLSRMWPHQFVFALPLILVWASAALAAVWWAGQFRCPRCSRRYGALGNKRRFNVTRGLFDDVCANCKLAKFEHPS
jgi:hypothetical protein